MEPIGLGRPIVRDRRLIRRTARVFLDDDGLRAALKEAGVTSELDVFYDTGGSGKLY